MLSIALSLRSGLLFLTLSGGALAALSGCAGTNFQSGISRPQALNAAFRTELYFGEVSEAQFRRFINDEVTPRFPDGLTWIPANGQWRDQTGKILREPSHILILIHDGSRATEAKIEALRTIFAKRHDEESVMRVSWPVRVAF